MSLIIVNSISQVEPIASPAAILIRFTVGGILPDKVQVYAGGIGGELALLKDEVDMTPPEIHPGAVEELAGDAAEKLN